VTRPATVLTSKDGTISHDYRTSYRY
jgi:hypothetical protein